MAKDYSHLSKEELIKKIEKLESRKKYGLIWDEERTKEKFEKDAENALPVLREISSKEITDKNLSKPVNILPVNILIEGDNYHALSVLNFTHQEAIDLIYIDPPYNTGNKDFKYNDNYVDREDAYRHSKWLAFMEKRLKLAKRLLKPAGLIFMSIDDNEEAQLRLLCDEIFDGKNFVAMLPTIMNLKGNQDQFGFAGTHEYTLVYAKDFTQAKIGEFQLNDEDWDNWEEDEGGFFKKGANLKATGVNAPRAKRPNLFFPIFITTDGFYVTENDKPKSSKDLILLPITDGKEMSWRWSKGKIKNETGNLIIERNVNGATIYKKQRPSIGDLPSKKPKTIFYKPEYSSGNGTAQLKNILGSKAFNNPKPMDLIKDFVTLSTPKDGVVLDFMAGSGTTGHAVLELNKEDGGNRKFILCTNNESNLEMSATPRLIPSAADITRGSAAYVIVEPKDVIEEGMIKKELIVNGGIAKIAANENDSQEAILEAAYEKRLELKKKFEKEGSNINPLVLVQIPNAEAGEAKIEAVKEFLSKKHITEKNGKLAIWMAEQKSETIDWISELDNEIEFLIFKQAIDTGWDCPRAHILVKFRESHSETFEIQTVGRILRMPEQKHYGNEDLNRGYIYTNVQSILVKKEEYNPNIIKHLRAVRISTYKPVRLQSYYKARADYGDITSSFTPVFEKTANAFFGLKGNHALFLQNRKQIEKKGIILNAKKYEEEIIADTKLQGKSFDELEGRITPEALAKLSIAGNDLQAKFEQVIKNNLGSFRNVKRSVPDVKTAIYVWFRKYVGSKEWNEEILLIQSIFLHERNLKTFEKILSNSIEAYKEVKEAEVREKVEKSEQYYEFELPKEQFFNEHTDELVKSAKRYAFDPCYLDNDRSDPEKKFERFLNENADKIVWWWKNRENKQDYFGVRYEYEGGIYAFYPDYLVQLKNGRIGIFEVKDSADRDGKTWTKAKAEALQKWIINQRRKDISGGVVIERNRDWYVSSERKYDWGKCERGDWGEWKNLDL